MSEQRSNTPQQPQRRPRVSRNRKKTHRSKAAFALLYALFIVGMSAVLATVGWIWANDLLALNKEYTSVIVTVDNDESFGKVVDDLKDKGLIEYKFLFHLYGLFSNADDKITPGTYELNTNMDYRALVTNMSSSSSTRQTIDITIPEGYTIDQLFQLLEEQGVTTVEKLQDMSANWDYNFSWLKGLPLGDYHRLEGYLFPDTYTFYLGEDAKYVLNKMLVNFEAKMGDYLDQFNEESKYSLHDIVTIASMIEKETDGKDYATIASVIYNRLENTSAETQGYLQIDATLVYLNGGKVPTEADKAIDSPYNTYLYQGLPAGPISNPGMTALYAAIKPEDTSYYYYVLNPETKRHEFSKTYAQHQALVEKYGTSNEEG